MTQTPIPTLKTALQKTIQAYQQAGYSNEQGKAEALWMIEHATGATHTQIYTHPDITLSQEQSDRLLEWRHRRLTLNEPLQYILGQATFYGRVFQCSPAALIPRPETEWLIDWALNTLTPPPTKVPLQILDIGTGTGCIAITLALEFQNRYPHCPIRITAMDTSASALSLAEKNAHQLTAPALEFIQQDIFTAKPPYQPYHAIVSNPPYINAQDYNALPPHIRCHEPKQALHAPNNGLLFYQHFSTHLPQWLAPCGWLACEFANGQEDDLIGLFSTPIWSTPKIHPDTAGLPRMLTVQRS